MEDGARHRCAQSQVNVVTCEEVQAEQAALARYGQVHHHGLQRAAHEAAGKGYLGGSFL